MKKILIFSLVYYPKHVHGGAEVAIKEITDRIPKEDIEFHMVTLGYDSNLPRVSWEGNVRVYRTGLMEPGIEVEQFDIFPLFLNKYLYLIWIPLKALILHRKEKYDATWAMMAHPSGVPQAIFGLFAPRVTRILTLQEGDPPAYMERLYKPLWPLFKRAFTRADVIQVISSFLGKWAKRMGFPGEPVRIPNGVNVKHFSQSYTDEALQAARDALGKKEGEVFLVTTSRLFKKNGIDTVIRALALLPESVAFIVYGEGPEESGLRKLAEELGVKDRVHFKGLIGREEMPRYMKACDIFIRPSRSEGMGNSFVEAMAAGLPVIASQEGGIADFLFDEARNPDKAPTGWAVGSESPEDIAAAVTDISNNPEQVATTTANAYELVTNEYDWDLVAKDMHEKVFNRVTQ